MPLKIETLGKIVQHAYMIGNVLVETKHQTLKSQNIFSAWVWTGGGSGHGEQVVIYYSEEYQENPDDRLSHTAHLAKVVEVIESEGNREFFENIIKAAIARSFLVPVEEFDEDADDEDE